MNEKGNFHFNFTLILTIKYKYKEKFYFSVSTNIINLLKFFILFRTSTLYRTNINWNSVKGILLYKNRNF